MACNHDGHAIQIIQVNVFLLVITKDFLATLRGGSFTETPLTARSSALRRFSWMSCRPKSKNPTRKIAFAVTFGCFQDTMRVLYTFCIWIYSIYWSLFQDGTWCHFTGGCWSQACWNFENTTVTIWHPIRSFITRTWSKRAWLGLCQSLAAGTMPPFCQNLTESACLFIWWMDSLHV